MFSLYVIRRSLLIDKIHKNDNSFLTEQNRKEQNFIDNYTILATLWMA